MGKLYFLGGENVAKQDAKEINSMAFEDAGGTPDVLVFPWARASFDVRFRRQKRLIRYFRSLGAREVNFLNYSESPKEIVERMANSDLVYLTGGQVSVLVSRLKAKGVDKFLCDYEGVIVGRSAGAVVLGKKGLVTNRYSGNRETVEGIGLVNFSVKAHYQPSQDGLLRQSSRKEIIYAVSQRSALIFDRKTFALTALGEVFIFQNGEKTTLENT